MPAARARMLPPPLPPPLPLPLPLHQPGKLGLARPISRRRARPLEEPPPEEKPVRHVRIAYLADSASWSMSRGTHDKRSSAPLASN